MGKTIRQKPGPKSVKESRILSKRDTLGETSCDDDVSPEKTLLSPRTPEVSRRKNKPQREADVSEFRTPDAEDDATDYGLEFTTSYIQHPSPRRCSTLKSAPNSQEEQQNSGENRKSKENRQNFETPLNTKPPEKYQPQNKVNKKQRAQTKTKNVPEEKATSAGKTSGPGQQQIVKSRRKQNNPLQLEKRFWKEVKTLQTRTDNLIPMLPFSRLVREIMQETSTEVTKITPTALGAIQAASELYLTQRLQDAYMLTLHRGRVTLEVRDMQMINYLKINF
ncbi:centromere identifier [Cochliomyia hominivorax]